MKSMTCRELGGACDQTFTAETFEEMAALSRKHGMEMFQKGDAAHLEAMEKMKALMQSPGAMQEYMAQKKAAFDFLPED